MLTDRLKRSAQVARKPTDSSPSRWHHGPWWSNSYLLTPLISILVFLVVMSLILWSLNRREQQQQEDTLYRNVAWAQQQIRLSMTGAQEQIQALARDIASGHGDPQTFQTSSTDIMQGHPEILYMNWYTSEHKPRWPNTPLPVFGSRLAKPNDSQMEEAVQAAFDEARSTRRQVYSPLLYD
ncbi:Chemotaxis regulator-transmits chemoreceptor signals to flagelllar motor components CheY, partial [Candidatus Burkholderia humilis]